MAAPRFATWEAAGRDAGRAMPGARALMALILLIWGGRGAQSWGIYNFRPTALGNPSAHGEGRALDVGCSIRIGRLIVRRLLRYGPAKLGICAIIHNRVIYSAKSPNGRRYDGVPHLDHVHIEMTRRAARDLTLAKAKRVLGYRRAA